MSYDSLRFAECATPMVSLHIQLIHHISERLSLFEQLKKNSFDVGQLHSTSVDSNLFGLLEIQRNCSNSTGNHSRHYLSCTVVNKILIFLLERVDLKISQMCSDGQNTQLIERGLLNGDITAMQLNCRRKIICQCDGPKQS